MSTNFLTGQVLTAAQLNNALNSKLDTNTGGEIKGDLSVENIVAKTAVVAPSVKTDTVTVTNAIDIESGGTGANTDTGAVQSLRYQHSDSRSKKRSLQSKFADVVSLKDFGAVGDDVTDDTQAIKNFVDFILSTGKAGYAPKGTYKVTDQINFDMGLYQISRGNGFRLHGEGLRRSVFKSYYQSGSAFVIKSTDKTQNGNCFYPEIIGMGFENYAPHPCMQVGQRDFSDEINAVVFNFSANCGNATVGACGLELNGVYQGDLNVTSNAGGTSTLGDAWRFRQAQFLRITGSGGNAANSIRFVDGYSYANVFTNFDHEEVKTCVKIETPNAMGNTFIGSQMSWSEFAIDATAGSNNIFLNPNFGLANNQVLGSVGISVTGQGKQYGVHYQPPTVFECQSTVDVFNKINAKTGNQAGQIFQNAGVDKFMLSSDGNNLFTRAWNAGLNRYLDASWVDTNGVLNVNQSKVNYFGLGVTPSGVQTLTGSRSNGTALANLIKIAVGFGFIVDNTTS